MRGEERPGFLLIPLAISQALYSIGVGARNALYNTGVFHAQKAPLKVISVGNLTVGGSGKTPFVELAAGKLQGKKAGILSRGYGSGFKGDYYVVSDGEKLFAPPPVSADEAYMLAKKLRGVPVAMAPDRRRGAEKMSSMFGLDVLVLDDGFQHRAIHRDLNILLLDISTILGEPKLFPLGTLREPLSEIRRADLVVITSHGGEVEENMLERAKKVIRETVGPDIPTIAASGGITGFYNIEGGQVQTPSHPCLALSGVASPERFINSLTSHGLDVCAAMSFPDHHNYTEEDINTINTELRRTGARAVITTEKDSVRLLSLYQRLGKPLVVAGYEMRVIKGEKILDDALAAIFSD